MTLGERLRARRAEILRVAKAHGASNVRVFGSVSRGAATAASDVDLLVALGPRRSLLDQAALQQELEDLLGCTVDLVVEGGISPYLERQILAEARPL